MTIPILRLPAVQNSSGYPKSTLYLRMSQGLWPKPIHLGARSVGWPENEVATINAARISGKTEDEIRELVTQLEKSRKNLLEKNHAQ